MLGSVALPFPLAAAELEDAAGKELVAGVDFPSVWALATDLFLPTDRVVRFPLSLIEATLNAVLRSAASVFDWWQGIEVRIVKGQQAH